MTQYNLKLGLQERGSKAVVSELTQLMFNVFLVNYPVYC
jgi:hypothetical protein